MSDETPGSVTFRISDPDRAEKLLAAEEEHGSRSKALRNAIDVAYAESDDSSEDGLSGAARKAHRKLVEVRGVGAMLPLDAAESIMAQRINLKAKIVREVVTPELVSEGLLVVNSGQNSAHAVVRDPENPAPTTSPVDRSPFGVRERKPGLFVNPEASEDSPYHPSVAGNEDYDIEAEASERLDELAAAGEEASDA